MVDSSTTEIHPYVPRRMLDQDLMDYAYNEKVAKNNDGKVTFFDNTIQTQASINAIASPIPMQNNRRSITWNIPRLDMIYRVNPYVKRAVKWISSRALIKGIDISSQDEKVTSKEIGSTQEILNKLYAPLKELVEKGLVYGGSAGLIVLKGRYSEQDFEKPLIINSVKKDEFQGIKVLSRWYQIEPALDKPLISEIGEEFGITDPNMLGKPMYYRVNLSNGLQGFSGTNANKPLGKTMLVHVSWLLLFNPNILSHIETQVERYWSSSIIETAYVDLERHEMIWSATTKSGIKNNLGVLKIYGLDSTIVNEHTRAVMNGKIGLIKESSNHGVVAIGEKDDFTFAQSTLSGNEKVLDQSMRQLSNALSTPINILFPDIKNFDEESYLQSLYEVEDMQGSQLRPFYERLIPIAFRSLYGKKINHFKFDFKAIMTISQEKKAMVMNTMMEVVETAYEAGFIPQKDGIKMLTDLLDNPSNIFHNISKDYIEQVEKGDEQGKIITANTAKIELAKELNQFSDNNSGVSGVEHPDSKDGGKKGGDPTKSKRLFKRNVMNEKKGQE